MRIFEYIGSYIEPQYIRYIMFDNNNLLGFCYDKNYKQDKEYILAVKRDIKYCIYKKYSDATLLWKEIKDIKQINLIKMRYL